VTVRIQARGLGKRYREWALRDLSLDVRAGEVLGIVGPNGAGKSTFLKLLAEITCPTEGTLGLRGRVGSILEAGTGFHWELTGRENVYLSGTILGMKRREIDRRFDEIVAFSGVEEHLDVPVKRYSSGMYMRLAFAVAAHLETEILVVDEVLAVGDAEFQRKCLATLGEVGGEGRTVLFVSHNMAAVERACTRAVLLDGGRLVADGAPAEVVARYLGAAEGRPYEGGAGSGRSRVTRVEATGDAAVEVGLAYALAQPEPGLDLEISVRGTHGAPLVVSRARDAGLRLPCALGSHEVRASLDLSALLPGSYSLGVRLLDGGGDLLDAVDHATTLRLGEGTPPSATGGLVRADATWRAKFSRGSQRARAT
jgi:lipopolysaccharide transport system ATP-binding protein